MSQVAPTYPQPTRATELQQVLRAERAGAPFILYRDETGDLEILSLAPGEVRCTIGRHESNHLALSWDSQVSRVHAELERIGNCWAVTDDGLSTNGTFINGARLDARRRLGDGDTLRVGTTVLVFREPGDSPEGEVGGDTVRYVEPQATVHLSPTQRRVLVALCRPFKHANGFASPATNQQIADELFLSVDRVKAHLRVLFERFELAGHPQNRKRLELAERALSSGLVTLSDL